MTAQTYGTLGDRLNHQGKAGTHGDQRCRGEDAARVAPHRPGERSPRHRAPLRALGGGQPLALCL